MRRMRRDEPLELADSRVALAGDQARRPEQVLRVGRELVLGVFRPERREQRQRFGVLLLFDQRLGQIERGRSGLRVVGPGREELAEGLDRALRPPQLEVAQAQAEEGFGREGRRRVFPDHVVVGGARRRVLLQSIQRLGFPEASFELLRRQLRDRAQAAQDFERFLRLGEHEPRPAQDEHGRHAPGLAAAVGAVGRVRERRARDVAAPEPGALAAVAGGRRRGFATAISTNTARQLTLPALARLGLADELDLIVTRDDMRALKPDPDGWRVISAHFGKLADGAGDPRDAVVVGDSWVDGVAAARAGVSFIAYRARQEDYDRWQVTPIVHLADLALLPAWLSTRRTGRP